METKKDGEHLTLLRTVSPAKVDPGSSAKLSTHDVDRGIGLRGLFDENQGAYIEFSRAAFMLSVIEQVRFSEAAAWLIERRAHASLQTFEKKHEDKSGLPIFEPFQPTNFDSEFSYGPLSVLYAIRVADDHWIEYVGAIQREANDRLRWKRDDFWRFVIDSGAANVTASSFSVRRDCPTFLIEQWCEPKSGTADADSHSDGHRMTGADWRRAAKQAEDRARALEARNAQLVKAIKQYEDCSMRRRGASKSTEAAPNETDQRGDQVSGKSRATMLRLIGGLAMVGAELDIHGDRIEGISDVLNDLAAKGVEISEPTLRSHLREAAKLIDPPKRKP